VLGACCFSGYISTRQTSVCKKQKLLGSEPFLSPRHRVSKQDNLAAHRNDPSGTLVPTAHLDLSSSLSGLCIAGIHSLRLDWLPPEIQCAFPFNCRSLRPLQLVARSNQKIRSWNCHPSFSLPASPDFHSSFYLHLLFFYRFYLIVFLPSFSYCCLFIPCLPFLLPLH
jgi:hypothetical protein